ncbi:MAG: hypothetical protein K8R35_00280 [Bacteroidales bacterium]|nr:hypothetical protein [Bacteroidales bacterium]
MSQSGDKLVDVLSGIHNCILFLHNTNNIETAKMIMEQGFRYESQMTYSTDRVSPNDPVEINYFLVERKEYGDYTIIIQIERSLFRQYHLLAETAELHFEEIFNVSVPVLGDNDEYIYTLSPRYIKGIFNKKTGAMIDNPDFNPSYDAPEYLENYNRLTKE